MALTSTGTVGNPPPDASGSVREERIGSMKGRSGERWEGGTRLRSEVSLALHVSELRRGHSEVSAG